MLSLSALAERTNVRIGTYTTTPPAWTFDLDAIADACEQLGVRMPVVVGCARYLSGRWAGMHGFANGEHSVNVGCSLDALEASAFLWHELTHAQQRERIGPNFSREYADAGGRKGPGYERNRFEVAARANEDLALAFPLVVG